MKFKLTLITFLLAVAAFAQQNPFLRVTKTVAVKDTIFIDSVSINSSHFLIKRKDQTVIDSILYDVDFGKALLTFKQPIESDSIIIDYLRYPEFLTKTYFQLDKSIIVEDNSNMQRFYKLSKDTRQRTFTPFEGLTTSGSISRGVTIGNNQNSVLNSELDLQISGKLSDKVSLRASIQDANIPLQESGYSQRLDEFDQVFIELYSDRWNIRAGDIDLQNNQSYFAEFSKRVQGLFVNANLGEESKTNVFAAGALVRGQFTSSQFLAQEGNQGPYKLRGTNNELYVLIVSGSETVYVNGVLVERGENKDYIIDYNAGEIIFNSTFPITSEMRITVDYQYSERNYSRLVAYGGGRYESEKFTIGATVYSENDAKNQPLQQNLSSEQVEILSNAGDDDSQMVAPSEIPESYNENRILYKKEFINSVEAFVFSTNPDDELYSVKFTLVGENQGNYVVSSTNAINTIFEYVEPISGVPQGNYEPIVQLVAPTKLQLAVVNGGYKPSDKTNIYFELAASKNDLNLFSDIDDNNNNGLAGKLTVNQALIKKDSLWSLNAMVDTDFIQKDFRTIQRLNKRPEFNRDWNLDQKITGSQLLTDFGNQTLITTGLQLVHPEKGVAQYKFEHLNFSEGFNGNRHIVSANLRLGKWNLYTNSSLSSAKSDLNTSNFTRSYNRLVYNFKKQWIGFKIAMEDNEHKENATQQLTELTQKFSSYEVFYGIGDSTNVFAEIGYKNRVNDSIRNNKLVKVNTSNTYYLKSQLIKNKQTNLSMFVNYRILDNEDETIEDEKSLNSRVLYNQKFFNQLVNWNTVFETNSGYIPQQDFTYVEVDEGQGAYTWIDYNENGIQELEEFELAQFQDQGTYVRVLLPNQVFLKTHQNKLSQLLTINPQVLLSSSDSKENFWSHFYNQTSYLVDRKIERGNNAFEINPFKDYGDDQLGLNLSFRNVLFFNRGKQRYTTSYTYLSNKTRNLLSVGTIENNLKSHQINFVHKMKDSWLFNTVFDTGKRESYSQNFTSKNFKIDEIGVYPKLSYLFNDNAKFDVFYQYANKENTIGNLEQLKQQNYGVSFSFSKSEKSAINGEFKYINNDFTGNQNSPVAYQMMEGLQPGKNFTWTLLAQKKLTKFLDLNLNYFGRKTESSNTIHTGTIQLKAYF